MPNNNPHGHNQYTKRQQPASKPTESGSTSDESDSAAGNFANDREQARETGRKGGEAHGAHR
jgi:general stress protein YciG